MAAVTALMQGLALAWLGAAIGSVVPAQAQEARKPNIITTGANDEAIALATSPCPAAHPACADGRAARAAVRPRGHGAGLDAKRRYDLYGVHFEVGQATIQPQSQCCSTTSRR